MPYLIPNMASSRGGGRLRLLNALPNINGYLVAISLDIKGAFDYAWWPAILEKLIELNCPKNLYRLIQSYLSDRTASLTIEGVSITYKRLPSRFYSRTSFLEYDLRGFSSPSGSSGGLFASLCR